MSEGQRLGPMGCRKRDRVLEQRSRARGAPGVDLGPFYAISGAGLHGEVTNDVGSDPFAPMLRDLRQPGAAVLAVRAPVT